MSIKDFCKFIKTFFKKECNMSKKIKKYRVNPDESMCLALSIVDSPAVETEFVCLGKQEMEKFVAVENKERRMIYGCALRSDFPIYRNSKEKGEYYLEFDSDAIDKISKDFLKNGFQSTWTAGHEAEVEGLTITESWIKESPTMDKSIAVGLDPSISVGSWFIGCHCENDEIWSAVKEGRYHGFSCEALVGIEEFEKQMKEEEVVEEPHVIEPTNVDLEGQEPAPTEEPQNEPQPTAVEEPKPTEEPKVEEPKVEEPVVEEPKPIEEPKPQEEPKPTEPNPLEELVKNLTEEIKALKSANDGLQEKIKDLGKQPSAEPVNVNAKPTVESGIGSSTYKQWRSQMASYLGY